MSVTGHPKFVEASIATLYRLDANIEYQVTEFVESLRELESIAGFTRFHGVADCILQIWEKAKLFTPESVDGLSIRNDLMNRMYETASAVTNKAVPLEIAVKQSN